MSFPSIVICLFSLILTSCAKKYSFRSRAQEPSEIRIGVLGKPELNWMKGDPFSKAVVSQLVEPLIELELKEGKLQLVGRIIRKWDFSSPLLFNIQMDESSHWDDGTLVTAQQLVESWRSLLATSENPNHTLLSCILNAKAFSERAVPFSSVGITIVSPSQLQIRFQNPCPNFPFLLTQLPLTPRLNYPWSLTSGRLLPCPFRSEGPWMLESFFTSNEILLKPNPHLATPVLAGNRLRFQFLSQMKEARSLMQDKQLDLVLLEKNPPLSNEDKIQSFVSPNSIVLTFNPNRKPFQNLKVREWLIQGISRNELIRLIGFPAIESTRLFSFFEGEMNAPEFHPDSTPRDKKWIDSLGTAFQLAVPHQPVLQAIAKNLKAQWKKNLNLDVELISSENNENAMMSLQHFKPDFSKRSLGLEEWAKFSTFDFFSPLHASLGTPQETAPFKLYEQKLLKMEQWAVAEEKWVMPLVSLKQNILIQPNISLPEQLPFRETFTFKNIRVH